MKLGVKICLFLGIVSFLPNITVGQLTWTRITGNAAWVPRELHASVVFDSAIWVIYGRNPGGGKDIWRSENGADWTLVTTTSGYRYDHMVVVHNDKMWLLGGYDNGDYKNDVWYSEDGINWTQVLPATPIWSPRLGHAVVVFNNKLWVLGGFSYPPQPYNDVWYSTNGDSWTLATASAGWSPRFWHRAVVFDNKIWVMGGWDPGSRRDRNDVWYSSDGINWTQAIDSAPWLPRHLHTVVNFEGKMFVLGGYYTARELFFNDAWYSGDGINWTEARPTGLIWDRRQAHTAVVFNNKIWIMGGEISFNVFLNDVWSTTQPTGSEENPNPAASYQTALSFTPNPVSQGFLTVHLPNWQGEESGQLEIFDCLGRNQGVWRTLNPTKTFTLDISQLNPGIYLARYRQGDYKVTGRFLVK